MRASCLSLISGVRKTTIINAASLRGLCTVNTRRSLTSSLLFVCIDFQLQPVGTIWSALLSIHSCTAYNSRFVARNVSFRRLPSTICCCNYARFALTPAFHENSTRAAFFRRTRWEFIRRTCCYVEYTMLFLSLINRNEDFMENSVFFENSKDSFVWYIFLQSTKKQKKKKKKMEGKKKENTWKIDLTESVLSQKCYNRHFYVKNSPIWNGNDKSLYLVLKDPNTRASPV